MSELRALRVVASHVEKILSGVRADDLVHRMKRMRGSVTTLQPRTRDVVKLLDWIEKAKTKRKTVDRPRRHR
jgi:hypothetical protein